MFLSVVPLCCYVLVFVALRAIALDMLCCGAPSIGSRNRSWCMHRKILARPILRGLQGQSESAAGRPSLATHVGGLCRAMLEIQCRGLYDIRVPVMRLRVT